MISDHELTKIIQDLISRRSEGVYWDFKVIHHANTGDLVHDVLCLANADHNGPRFLIFGVQDGGTSIESIENDEGRRAQAEIAGLFRDNASKFFQSRFPTFYLRTIEMGDALIDVLVIEDKPKKPYYLVERLRNVCAHHIFTRVGDTNTPVDRSAQPHAIVQMWRQRFGLDATALDRAKLLLAEPKAWTFDDEDGLTWGYHDVFPEFTLKAASAENDHLDCSQEWTRGEIRTNNNSAGWFELRFHATLLRRIHYVSFDNHKKRIVAPDWEPIGQGRFYFYKADSIRYSVHRFWIDIYKRDDSKGLLIRGLGESAMEAHARWKGQYNIPVLEPGELEDFLQQH